MSIYKNSGIIYSEYILNEVIYNFSDRKDIEGHVETFYNCREMGYVLMLHNEDYSKGLTIWIYNHRNSNEPTIAYLEEMYPNDMNNMFTEDTWLNRTFTFESITEAVKKAVKIIEDRFRN